MKSVAPCMSSHLDIDTTDPCCMTASASKSDFHSDFHSEEMQACFTKLMQLVPERKPDDEMDEMELLQDVIDYIKDLKDILDLQCDVLQSSSGCHTQDSGTMTTDECLTSTLSTSSPRRSAQDDWSPLPPSE